MLLERVFRVRDLSTQTVSGLRTRYFPKSRIGQGLIQIAPWVNLILLLIMFSLLDSKIVLQPGIVVDLPKEPFRDGSRPTLRAVVLAVRNAQQSGLEEIVFFDDNRYIVRRPESMGSLKEAMTQEAHKIKDVVLVIEADRQVRHGTVMSLMNMALDAGIRKVNVAERPE